MLLRGAKPKVISEALGHSSIAFTMDVYSHIIEGMQSDAMRYSMKSYHLVKTACLKIITPFSRQRQI